MRPGLHPAGLVAAVAVLTAVLSSSPAGAQPWKDAYLRGVDLMDAQRWDEAVEAFDRAIEANPRESWGARLYGMRFGYFPHRDKGVALYQMGEWAAAVEALEESLRQGASDSGASYLMLARRRQPAVTLLRLFRGEWWDFYERGFAAIERGLWGPAIEDFRTALAARSREAHLARTYGVEFIEYFPLRELGVALYNDGQFDAAVGVLERSLAGVPTARAELFLILARAARLRESLSGRRAVPIRLRDFGPGLRASR